MNDLAIQFSDASGKHLYEQIYEYIRDEIKEGKLLAGEKLPSARSLAGFLQVSRSTVDLAYGQLQSEGYIESRPYRGYYICRVEELYHLDVGNSMGRGKEKEEKQSVRWKGAAADSRSIETTEAARKLLAADIDFSPNAVDMTVFPFDTWRRITRDILRDDRKDLFALGEARGDKELRYTICRYLHSSRGVEARPEQIIVGAGNDYLLQLLQYILGRDIRVAFENYSYPRAWRIFSSFARKVMTVPMDENGMRVDALQKTDADIAYVMPSHQYPTGIVMPIGRRLELLKWASAEPGRYLIEDDYDSEFRYRGKPVPALQGADRAGKVIYIGSFSKSIAPAIRVSFMVLPPELLERYEANCSFFSSTVSRIDQTILNEFITSGAYERHLNKMRKTYKEKHDLILEELKPFSDRYRILGENTGLHVVLRSRALGSEKHLIDRAAQCGVQIYGMHDAWLGETGADAEKEGEKQAYPTILLGYAGLNEQKIKEGIRRLASVL